MWIEGGGRRRNCEVGIAAEGRCGEGVLDVEGTEVKCKKIKIKNKNGGAEQMVGR